jgi:uncharacterized FlaG/YvyC family protein
MVEEADSITPVGSVSDSASGHENTTTGLPRVVPPAPRAPIAQKAAKQPTAQDVQAAAQRVNDYLASSGQALQLRVDTGTGLTMAIITNAKTGEVLQQIPSTDLLRFAQMLEGWSPGKNVLIDLFA